MHSVYSTGVPMQRVYSRGVPMQSMYSTDSVYSTGVLMHSGCVQYRGSNAESVQ